MSTAFVEGNLLFEFGPRWTSVFRWDGHEAYTDGMMTSHQGKAVDFFGIFEERLPFMIEVKDYRLVARSPAKGPLEHEIEMKVRSTVAALMGVHFRAGNAECVKAFDALLQSRKPYIVFWHEEARPERLRGPGAVGQRRTRAGILGELIKRNMRWLATMTIVANMHEPDGVPDVVVTDLPPERKEKAERIEAILTSRGRNVPPHVTRQIRDCLDLVRLDKALERAAAGAPAWKLFSP